MGDGAVTTFGIPDADEAMRALAIPDEARMEAWEIAAQQADSLTAIAALESRLYARLDLLRGRDASPAIERRALALLAERRTELAAYADSRAGTGGNRGPMMKD